MGEHERNGLGRTFFMIPALRLEKVMWRRDLSWMNLISIFLRSRPGLSSSSSSSSWAGRGRLVPRFASAWRSAPLLARSSLTLGDAFWSWSVISEAMVLWLIRLVARGRPNCFCRANWFCGDFLFGTAGVEWSLQALWEGLDQKESGRLKEEKQGAWNEKDQWLGGMAD